MSSDKSFVLHEDKRSYKMNLMTLRFRDREIEDRFSADNFARQIDVTRLSIILGAGVFGLFGILDVYAIPDVVYYAWAARFALACPFLLLLVAATYSPRFTHRVSGLLSAAIVAPAAAIIYMTAIADPPGAYLYYGGLIVVLGYSSCLWRMRFLHAAGVSLLVVVAYEWVAFDINPIPNVILASNSTFLCSAALFSAFISYIQEYQLRKSFIDNERLRFEQTRSERLLSRSEAANRSKNDFLAIMSHELRTPLNAIIGFSEIIANQMFGPIGQAKYADYAGDIRSSGTHLLSIINDILDISKAEAGKLQLEEEPIDPVESLNRAMRMFRQRASELGVELSFRVRDDMPWIIADPRLFNQVAINLTSNALKFTPEGGHVWIEIGLDASGDMALSVKDTGIGVKKSDIERIFEPFVQVENAMSRTHHGTGLGLPLVRKIMNLHGGTVELESSVGKGTTVIATFPKSRFVQPDVVDEIRWNVR